MSLRLCNISKQYGKTWVLNNVSCSFSSGKIYGLVGVNGSGKSTLLKIAAGVERPTHGEIVIDTESTAKIHDGDMKVGFVPQELPIVPDLSVAENVLLGNWPQRFGVLRRVAIRRIAEQTLASVGLDIDVGRLSSELSISERQLVVIARTLSQSPDVVLLDEPTSSLTPSEVGRLFRLVRDIANQGKIVLIVSQRLDDIATLCDGLSILREGELIASGNVADFTPAEVVDLMLYGSLDRNEVSVVHRRFSRTFSSAAADAPGLVLDSFQTESLSRPVSLVVPGGQVLGVVGLPGSGASELLRGVFGIQPAKARKFSIFGNQYKLAKPRRNIDRRVAYVTGDRQQEGLVLTGSVAMNIAMTLDRSLFAGHRSLRRSRRAAINQIHELKIHPPKPDIPIGHLSGGNQQKVIFSRSLLTDPRMWILDDPTRGVDIGARRDIHEAIRKSMRNGRSLALMLSSDISEIFEICDRIIVFWQGEIVGDLLIEATNPIEIEMLMVGASNGVNSQ